MADEVLILVVRRAQRGNTQAFDILVRRFQNAAVAYARTLLRDPAAAEDAAQEAFLQAWRDLPSLVEPAAFGSWLRRIVFKFCDRHRRSERPVLPLHEAIALDADHDPARQAERVEVAEQVRAAIADLPGPLRESILLYYFTGRDIREVAAFLELPPSTVKNRLHTARKRLRKELWIMAEILFDSEKPSQTPAFAENVLTCVLREFERQEATDPHTADRRLLDEGRTALFETLGRVAVLDDETVRDGFMLLWRKQDWPAVSALLMRYLTQPLSDSETAWAYANLVNTIALGGSAAGAVLAHEAFERWLPGRSPCLSAQWPFYPASPDGMASVYAGDEVRLLFLSRSVEFTSSYLGVWRHGDYLAKVDAALAEIPLTPQNRGYRFFVLRMAYHACEIAKDLHGVNRYIDAMFTLADGSDDTMQQAELRARALGHAIDLARRMQDESALDVRVEELNKLLNAVPPDGSGERRWVRGQRHELACQLVYAGRHGDALPLWEANAASGGQIGGWGWLLYAATVWHVTHDRERTLHLLREARAHDDRDLMPLFEERPEFEDVRTDAQFRQAVSVP